MVMSIRHAVGVVVVDDRHPRALARRGVLPVRTSQRELGDGLPLLRVARDGAEEPPLLRRVALRQEDRRGRRRDLDHARGLHQRIDGLHLGSSPAGPRMPTEPEERRPLTTLAASVGWLPSSCTWNSTCRLRMPPRALIWSCAVREASLQRSGPCPFSEPVSATDAPITIGAPAGFTPPSPPPVPYFAQLTCSSSAPPSDEREDTRDHGPLAHLEPQSAADRLAALDGDRVGRLDALLRVLERQRVSPGREPDVHEGRRPQALPVLRHVGPGVAVEGQEALAPVLGCGRRRSHRPRLGRGGRARRSVPRGGPARARRERARAARRPRRRGGDRERIGAPARS